MKLRKRPLPTSLIEVFGQNLAQLEFNFMTDMSSTQLVATFQDPLSKLVMQVFPERTITIDSNDNHTLLKD